MTDEEFKRNLDLQELFLDIFAPGGKGQVRFINYLKLTNEKLFKAIDVVKW